MEEVWFSNSSVSRGIRILTWDCDNDGSFIDIGREDRPMSRTPSSRNQGLIFSPSGNGSFRSFDRESTSRAQQVSCLSDRDLSMKLDSLIRDAGESFQQIMRRNADLEQELEFIRSRVPEVSLPSAHRASYPSPSPMGPHQQLRIPLPKDSRDHSVFDISTPPTNTRIQRASDSEFLPQTLRRLSQRPILLSGDRARFPRTAVGDR